MKLKLEYEIGDDKIKVASSESCTLYISAAKIKPVEIGQFKLDFAALVKKLKENGVKLQRKRVKFLIENFPSYLSEVEKYNSLFAQLREVADAVVLEGLEPPTINNENLKRAHKISAEMEKMRWRSTVISQVHETNYTVKDYLNKNLANYEKIFI